jgi:6-pyruvoyltetrahydropterin/6-carboxytetrahydropterin synthase
MQETYIEFTFEAAHQTPPFSTLHGHSFKAQVFLRGEADPVYGWSHNLYEVEPIVNSVRNCIDHKYLNDIEGLSVPTLENLTKWLWQQLSGRIEGVDRVVVSRRAQSGDEGCVYSGRNLQ